MKKKQSTMDVLLLLFGVVSLIFGILFISVTLEDSEGAMAFKLFGGMAILAGSGFFIVWLRNFLILRATNRLYEDPNAYVTSAKLIDFYLHSTELCVSGNYYIKYYMLIYEYVDEMGVSRQVKSKVTYSEKEVAVLRKIKYFSIKCKGKRSCIIEDFKSLSNDNKNP